MENMKADQATKTEEMEAQEEEETTVEAEAETEDSREMDIPVMEGKEAMDTSLKVETEVSEEATAGETLEEKVSVNDGDNEEEGIVDSPLKFLNLDMYEADSADQLVCPDILCAKTFKRRRLLENHIKRVHVGDRNFLCDFCPKRFHSKREKTAM